MNDAKYKILNEEPGIEKVKKQKIKGETKIDWEEYTVNAEVTAGVAGYDHDHLVLKREDDSYAIL